MPVGRANPAGCQVWNFSRIAVARLGRGRKGALPVNKSQVNDLVRGAAPTCSSADGASEGYRVWLENPLRAVKARMKRELQDKLTKEA